VRGVYRIGMRFSLRCLVGQFFIASLVASLTGTSHAQKSARPIIVAHDVIDGPASGAHSVEVLTVLPDGTVTYSVQSKAHKSFTAKLKSADLSDLANLLNLQEIRGLPNDIAAKMQPTDFFWNQTLKIARVDETQSVQIEHFYPFLNLNGTVYPQKLIELECKLQDIKASASKGQKDDGDWCKEILVRNFSESDSHKCSADEAQWQVEEDHGWGPVRVGARLQSIEQVLGKGIPSETFSDVQFFEYRSHGIEISFEKSNNEVHAIYFYNHQQGSGQFGVFCGKVAKGITWASTIEDVRNAYGDPSADFMQGSSGRLQYSGIDFRFENGKLVRVGVPGR
jgi:hypothetical protein